MSISLTITGSEALVAELKRRGLDAKPAAAAALFQEAEDIMGTSKEEYVPTDDSILKNSGHVAQPDIDSDEISVAMGYGGAASAYALAVHEHLSEHSPPSWKTAEAKGRPVRFHPSGRGPKYLERPLLAAASGMAGRLAGRMVGWLKGG